MGGHKIAGFALLCCVASVLDRLALVAVLAAIAPAAARAQPPVAASPDDLRLVDAAGDRVGLFGTAETHPAGTLFFTDYDIAVLQLGYAFTDGVQGAVTALPPVLAAQNAWFIDVTMKFNVLRDELLRVAVLGALTTLFNRRAGDNAYGVRAGGVVSLCFTRDCWSSISMNLQAFVNDEGTDYLPVIGSAGLLARVGELVSVILEPSYALIVGEDDIAALDGFLITYGLRLGGSRVAVDLALVKPFGEDIDFGPFQIFGVPLVTFTWRSAPGE